MQKIVKFLKSSLRPVAFEYFLVAAAVSLVLFASINLVVQALKF